MVRGAERRLSVAIASAFGLGRAPVAPGTVGSLAGLVLGAGLLSVSPWAALGGGIMVAAVGIAAIAGAGGADDPGWVVIDEVAGQMIALCGLAQVSWLGLLAAFVAFRAFDIVKPWPISAADRRHGPVWVMADDVLAGLCAAALLAVIDWAARTLGLAGGLW